MSRKLLIKAIFFLAIVLSLLSTGCATMKGLLGMETEKSRPVAQKIAPVVPLVDGEPAVRFSENSNLPVATERSYKRTTRQKLEEESELHAQAGSMWVMEGQGAYLFAQNKSRREGDLLNVRIEGAAQKQIETKVSVIKKLLKQLEDEEKKQKEIEDQRRIAETQKAPTEDQKAGRGPASDEKKEDRKAEAKEDKDEPLDLAMVPTRIVERQAEGPYRVKGQQPFMIGKREYKVIITGMIRPEDFNDEGVSSNKLLDPQFDVVSLRRKE